MRVSTKRVSKVNEMDKIDADKIFIDEELKFMDDNERFCYIAHNKGTKWYQRLWQLIKNPFTYVFKGEWKI